MPCASSTTSNEGSARNRLAPFGFGAARPHLLRCRSSAILRYLLRRGVLQLEPRRPERMVSYV
jgi:hypothetical protein